MRQNQLYLIIGALIVVVIALGIYVWREESKPDGVELENRRIRHFDPGKLSFRSACGRSGELLPSRPRPLPHLTPP